MLAPRSNKASATVTFPDETALQSSVCTRCDASTRNAARATHELHEHALPTAAQLVTAPAALVRSLAVEHCHGQRCDAHLSIQSGQHIVSAALRDRQPKSRCVLLVHGRTCHAQKARLGVAAKRPDSQGGGSTSSARPLCRAPATQCRTAKPILSFGCAPSAAIPARAVRASANYRMVGAALDVLRTLAPPTRPATRMLLYPLASVAAPHCVRGLPQSAPGEPLKSEADGARQPSTASLAGQTVAAESPRFRRFFACHICSSTADLWDVERPQASECAQLTPKGFSLARRGPHGVARGTGGRGQPSRAHTRAHTLTRVLPQQPRRRPPNSGGSSTTFVTQTVGLGNRCASQHTASIR